MRTHWEGCWSAHHECAMAEAVRLRAEVERLKSEHCRDFERLRAEVERLTAAGICSSQQTVDAALMILNAARLTRPATSELSERDEREGRPIGNDHALLDFMGAAHQRLPAFGLPAARCDSRVVVLRVRPKRLDAVRDGDSGER